METRPSIPTYRKAQIQICRRWKQFHAKLQRGEGKVLVRVTFSSLSPTHPVLIGSFTSSPWTTEVPMRYSLAEKVYLQEVWMSVYDVFQVRDGNMSVNLPHFLSVRHPESEDEDCYLPAATLQQYRRMLSHYFKHILKKPCLSFKSASSVIRKGGKPTEDAHFLGRNLLGVGDGVGGWRQYGVDSGLFAQELLQACGQQELGIWPLVLRPEKDCSTPSLSYIHHITKTAMQSVKSYGGSTLILSSVHGDSLELMNLGDSKAMLIRFEGDKPKVVLKTRAMQHRFNTPYQLSRPLKVRKTSTNRSSIGPINDSPEVGEIYSINVEKDDLLLMGSDGLWDNVFEAEVLAKVHKGDTAEHLASRLAQLAYAKSIGKDSTPFEREVIRTHGLNSWIGGKQDDITVVASWLVEEDAYFYI